MSGSNSWAEFAGVFRSTRARSRGPNEMNLPGFRLHSLKGTLTGFWAVSVS